MPNYMALHRQRRNRLPGTSPGGVDVRDYVDVGITNMAVATGLTMQDGRTYFVSVRGEKRLTLPIAYIYRIILTILLLLLKYHYYN